LTRVATRTTTGRAHLAGPRELPVFRAWPMWTLPVKPGDKVWKTSDPQLERELRRTYKGDIPLPKTKIDLTVTGAVGTPLDGGGQWGARQFRRCHCRTAFKRPLTEKALRDQLSRLGRTDFVLGEIHNKLVGQTILPAERVEPVASRACAEDSF